MAREVLELKYRVGDRAVTIRVTETVAVEDVYDTQIKAVLHRYAVGEEAWFAAPREIKELLIKQNSSI